MGVREIIKMIGEDEPGRRIFSKDSILDGAPRTEGLARPAFFLSWISTPAGV